MDKLTAVQGVDHPTSGGKKLHERVVFPDFSAFQMTMTGAALASRASESNAGEAPAQDPPGLPPPGIAAGPAPGAAPGTNRGRHAAPPFSWLGSDAWPNFPLSADKGS